MEKIEEDHCWQCFMINKKKIFIASLAMISLSSSANSIYIVKSGDTLSSILYAKNINPIYGKSGALKKVLKLNPQISTMKGHKIFPDMKIVLIDFPTSDEIAKLQNSSLTVQETPLVETLNSTDSPNHNNQENKINIERLPSDDFKQSFFWQASPILSWRNLSSIDENAYRSSKVESLSNISYGADVLYGMHFAPGFDITSKLSLESVSFIEDSSIKLQEKSFITGRFAMGVLYAKKWSFELAMKDEFFLTSPNLLSVAIKKVTLPEVKTSYLKAFYDYRQAQLSYLVSGSAYLPRTSPDVKATLGYGVGGELQAKLHNQSFAFGYDYNFLRATNNSTNEQKIYWKYIWESFDL